MRISGGEELGRDALSSSNPQILRSSNLLRRQRDAQDLRVRDGHAVLGRRLERPVFRRLEQLLPIAAGVGPNTLNQSGGSSVSATVEQTEGPPHFYQCLTTKGAP